MKQKKKKKTVLEPEVLQCSESKQKKDRNRNIKVIIVKRFYLNFLKKENKIKITQKTIMNIKHFQNH